jgi:hypothetical protein
VCGKFISLGAVRQREERYRQRYTGGSLSAMSGLPIVSSIFDLRSYDLTRKFKAFKIMAKPVLHALVACALFLSVGTTVFFFFSACQILGFSILQTAGAVFFSCLLGAALSSITLPSLWREFRALAVVFLIAIGLFSRAHLALEGGTVSAVFVVACCCFMMFSVQAGLLWRCNREH